MAITGQALLSLESSWASFNARRCCTAGLQFIPRINVKVAMKFISLPRPAFNVDRRVAYYLFMGLRQAPRFSG